MRFAAIATFFALVGFSAAVSCPAGLPAYQSIQGCRADATDGHCHGLRDLCKDVGTNYPGKEGTHVWVCDIDEQCH